MRNAECGMRNEEKVKGNVEVGMRTRRRPIGRDYAAAKDAECGKGNAEVREVGSRNAEVGMRKSEMREMGMRKSECGMWNVEMENHTAVEENLDLRS